MRKATRMSVRPDFTIEIHQNRFLPVGGTEVHAIARATAKVESDAAVWTDRPTGAAEVIIVDTSASMVGERLVAAKRAAKVAVDSLREGVNFAIVSGSYNAAMVYPRDPLLAPATDRHRGEAKNAISKLSAVGGTRMGHWLRLANTLFTDHQDGIRHAILLTDGRNEHETQEELDATLSECVGRFVCDCRGVDAEWEPAELRRVATRLLGGFDMVADPRNLAADFEDMIERVMGKAVADVSLRIWTPNGVSVRFVKQRYPSLRDLTDRRAEVGPDAAGPATGDYPTGIWGTERRDYHLCVTVPAGEPYQHMLAARVSLVVPGSGATSDATLADGRVLVEWTDDEPQSTRVDLSVEHYAKQEELADSVQAGLEAYRRGDSDTASRQFRRAHVLAAETGNRGVSTRLDKVFDSATGEVRPKDKVDQVDEKDLDTQSSELVQPPPREDEDKDKDED
jgi:hypothetical protein